MERWIKTIIINYLIRQKTHINSTIRSDRLLQSYNYLVHTKDINDIDKAIRIIEGL